MLQLLLVVLMLLWVHRARVSLLLFVTVGATAVSQQGLELKTLLVLKLAVCLSVACRRTET